MTNEIRTAIKNIIKDAYNQKLTDEATRHAEHNARFIGTERTDYRGRRINRRIEFVNPKTGRINHRWERNVYPTYIYTQEMYDTELEKALDNIRTNFGRGGFGFNIQCNADDSERCLYVNDPFNVTDEEAEVFYNAYGFRSEHLTGFRLRLYKYWGDKFAATLDCIWPIFDEETDKEFNESRDSYMNAKAEWCSKYGCD